MDPQNKDAIPLTGRVDSSPVKLWNLKSLNNRISTYGSHLCRDGAKDQQNIVLYERAIIDFGSKLQHDSHFICN